MIAAITANPQNRNAHADAAILVVRSTAMAGQCSRGQRIVAARMAEEVEL